MLLYVVLLMWFSILLLPSIINLLTAIASLLPERKYKHTYPSVSVIVCAKNEDIVIKRKIDNLLSQDYSNFEVIIVDGKSIDKTREICKSYGEQIVLLDGGFGSKAKDIDFGVKHAKGDIILECDADSICPKNWIEEMARPFSNPDMGSVSGYVYCGNWKDNLLTRMRAIESFWMFCTQRFGYYQMAGGSMICGCSKAYRREIGLKYGCKCNKTLCEDAEFSRALLDQRILTQSVKVHLMQEEPSYWSSFLQQRFRWLKGSVDSFRKSEPRVSLYTMYINLSIDFVNFFSMLSCIFSRVFLVPLLINILVLLITLISLRSKTELYAYLLIYIFLWPFTMAFTFIALMITDLLGSEITWIKTPRTNSKLEWPVKRI